MNNETLNRQSTQSQGDASAIYGDIINMPRPESKRPKMSREARAAQFAPFAALDGHYAAIAETGRLTDKKRELSADEQRVLSERLNVLMVTGKRMCIRYFVADTKKDGGRYVSICGTVKRVDGDTHCLILTSGESIALDDIADIIESE